MAGPAISLALQGGGTHGAFTWGVLDRLLQEVEADRFSIAAISGASAGALNAAVTAAGLAEGGPALARQRLAEFWRSVSDRGTWAGNALFGFGEPGPFGFNIDWSPGAIFLEAAGLVISPYTNPFYADALAPVLDAAFPPDRLARLNQAPGPRLFLSAVNVATNQRRLFSQPDITLDAMRASACLPAEFQAVTIDGAPYWDGGYLGNPALTPLLGAADDLLLVMVNPLERTDMPPRSARAILDRLNQVTFNASVVLEMSAIAAINDLLAELQAAGLDYKGRYRPINLHMIRNDAFLAELGVVSKSSTSWPFLTALHRAGLDTATAFLNESGDALGHRSSVDIKAALTRPVLKG
ncbi:MAG: patatin-like phospholipase family protein [Acetobacteraceae bacterium]